MGTYARVPGFRADDPGHHFRAGNVASDPIRGPRRTAMRGYNRRSGLRCPQSRLASTARDDLRIKIARAQ